MASSRSVAVVARFPLVVNNSRTAPPRPRLLRLVDDVHALEESAPRSVDLLADMATELRTRADRSASLTAEVNMRLARALRQQERARAMIEELRAARRAREAATDESQEGAY